MTREHKGSKDSEDSSEGGIPDVVVGRQPVRRSRLRGCADPSDTISDATLPFSSTPCPFTSLPGQCSARCMLYLKASSYLNSAPAPGTVLRSPSSSADSKFAVQHLTVILLLARLRLVQHLSTSVTTHGSPKSILRNRLMYLFGSIRWLSVPPRRPFSAAPCRFFPRPLSAYSDPAWPNITQSESIPTPVVPITRKRSPAPWFLYPSSSSAFYILHPVISLATAILDPTSLLV
ncbi:hypothetical protein B0H14DRAFT_3464112 [Mycena olivaceomarginata]|nr:hypothetical protein B0H14DRAFT_3464112 [Mycena olivaceomarginata]